MTAVNVNGSNILAAAVTVVTLDDENDSFDQKLEKSAAVLGSLGIAEYTPTQDAAHGGRATVRLMDMAPAEISAAVKKLRDEGFQP